MTYTPCFTPADILLPKGGFERWACVACDQFTSQPEYWARADELVGDAPSALRLILPEVYLSADDSASIANINAAMRRYLDEGVFTEYKNAMILVERTKTDGAVRRGIVGSFALEAYSYILGEKSLVRPTEGTVLERIPPRVAIRRHAPLELPHIMVFLDDGKRQIIEGVDTSRLEKLYDFDLMLGGGHICGWLIDEVEQGRILSLLSALEQSCNGENGGFAYAVGDGNHSLASAKAAAPEIGTAAAQFALAELVNIHSDAIRFEPIYRVMFNIDPAEVIVALRAAFPTEQGRTVKYLTHDEAGQVFVPGLEAGEIQRFIDDYIASHQVAAVDYIHGEAALRELAAQENAIGFLYGGMDKAELFTYVAEHGILPRKSFSVGHAEDKRYYIEARKLY